MPEEDDALVQATFEHLPSMSLDARTQLREQFADLFKEAQGAIGEDPASPRAQRLAGRCADLLRILTTKSELEPRLLKLAAAYLSGRESPTGTTPPDPPFGGQPVWEFMSKALTVGRH